MLRETVQGIKCRYFQYGMDSATAAIMIKTWRQASRTVCPGLNNFPSVFCKIFRYTQFSYGKNQGSLDANTTSPMTKGLSPKADVAGTIRYNEYHYVQGKIGRAKRMIVVAIMMAEKKQQFAAHKKCYVGFISPAINAVKPLAEITFPKPTRAPNEIEKVPVNVRAHGFFIQHRTREQNEKTDVATQASLM